MTLTMVGLVTSVLFALCVYLYWKPVVEGLDTMKSKGVAGDSKEFGAKIKDLVIKTQDQLLISKYRVDYEQVILNTDELVDTLMLQNLLTLDLSNPYPAHEKISKLNQTKLALNNIIKYVDKSK
jgi:hypothetical protein